MSGSIVADGLREQADGRVITWTLDAPARKHAVNPAALEYIRTTCAGLRGHTVVLRAAGSEAFCAGFDLTALANAEPPKPDATDDDLIDAPLIAATEAMRRADATFVAAVNGYAIGAVVELVCACDLRIASEAAWFQVPAARLGVVYHADGLARIRAVFGEAGAAALLLLGRRLPAAQAHATGALLDVVPAARLDDAVAEIVAALGRGAPQSIAGNRTLLRALSDAALSPAARDAHADARRRAYGSADHREARAAVAEGRRPKFTGE